MNLIKLIKNGIEISRKSEDFSYFLIKYAHFTYLKNPSYKIVRNL
jgi:hypothetical protein